MKLVVFLLLLSTHLLADIYDEYQLTKDTDLTFKQDYFFDSEFDEIIRFDDIIFENGLLGVSAADSLKDLSQKINSYRDGKREFYVSIIGHTQAITDDENEKRIESTTYANRIQNIFRDSYDINQSIRESKSYAKKVKEHLLDNNVSEASIHLEYRNAYDKAYSDETEEGDRLSNRVMVTLYVEENMDIDDDGVLNSRDFCPDTKKGIRVDRDGCKFKSIVLLVDNNKQKNAIVVGTKQNSITIDSAKDYSYIKSKNDTARLYKRMDDKVMKEVFRDVLESNDLTTFTIYFSDREFVDSSEKFYEVVDFLSKHPDSYVQVIGHTDSKGNAKYNEVLAKKRADAVAKRIEDSGVSYLHMVVESYGEKNLAVQTADETREALNRRVEILIR